MRPLPGEHLDPSCPVLAKLAPSKSGSKLPRSPSFAPKLVAFGTHWATSQIHQGLGFFRQFSDRGRTVCVCVFSRVVQASIRGSNVERVRRTTTLSGFGASLPPTAAAFAWVCLGGQGYVWEGQAPRCRGGQAGVGCSADVLGRLRWAWQACLAANSRHPSVPRSVPPSARRTGPCSRRSMALGSLPYPPLLRRSAGCVREEAEQSALSRDRSGGSTGVESTAVARTFARSSRLGVGQESAPPAHSVPRKPMLRVSELLMVPQHLPSPRASRLWR